MINNIESWNFIITLIGFYIILNLFYNVVLSNIENLNYPHTNSISQNNIIYFLNTIIISFNIFLYKEKLFDFSYFFYVVIIIFFTLLFTCITKSFVIKNLVNVFFEYDFTILILTFCLLAVVTTKDPLFFYICVELLSLCCYLLAASYKKSLYCSESSIKYFILGSLSSCFLLFSLSLLYNMFGTTELLNIHQINNTKSFVITDFICIFLIMSFTFKLGLFPCHAWLLDVYDGSPLNVTTYFSSIPKLALFIFFIRLFQSVSISSITNHILVFSSLGSIFIGSFGGIYQKRLKRLLAYSTLSHTGFIVINIYCFNFYSINASIFYLIIYSITNLCLFGLILFFSLSNSFQKYIINWVSLTQINTCFNTLFILSIFSMAGIPPLAGFFAKTFVLINFIQLKKFWLVIYLILFSCLSCYYYLKLIKVLSFNRAHYIIPRTKKSIYIELSITFLGLLFIVFFLYPTLLTNSIVLVSTFN